MENDEKCFSTTRIGKAFEDLCVEWLKKYLREKDPSLAEKLTICQRKPLKGRSGASYNFDIVVEGPGIFLPSGNEGDVLCVAECKYRGFAVETRDVCAFIFYERDINAPHALFFYAGHITQSCCLLLRHHGITPVDLTEEFSRSAIFRRYQRRSNRESGKERAV